MLDCLLILHYVGRCLVPSSVKFFVRFLKTFSLAVTLIMYLFSLLFKNSLIRKDVISRNASKVYLWCEFNIKKRIIIVHSVKNEK